MMKEIKTNIKRENKQCKENFLKRKINTNRGRQIKTREKLDSAIC